MMQLRSVLLALLLVLLSPAVMNTPSATSSSSTALTRSTTSSSFTAPSPSATSSSFTAPSPSATSSSSTAQTPSATSSSSTAQIPSATSSSSTAPTSSAMSSNSTPAPTPSAMTSSSTAPTRSTTSSSFTAPSPSTTSSSFTAPSPSATSSSSTAPTSSAMSSNSTPAPTPSAMSSSSTPTLTPSATSSSSTAQTPSATSSSSTSPTRSATSSSSTAPTPSATSSSSTAPTPSATSSSSTAPTTSATSSSFISQAPSMTASSPSMPPSSSPPVSHAVLYAGSVLAIACLLPVVVFFVAVSKELFSDHAHLVHANLSLSILLMFIVYCISIGAAGGTLNRLACKFATAFLHLFSLVPFAWLVCEMAVVLNLLVRKFRENSYKLSAAFMATAWGVPLLVVLLSVAVGHDHYLIIDKAKDTVIACWLPSGRTDLYLWWAFLAPMIILTFVTFLLIIIGCVLWVRVHMHGVRGLTSAKEAEILKVSRRPLINTTIILPLLCGTTIFGVAASNDPTESSAHPYLFFITSVALGLSMLLLLLVNKKAYQELKWLKQEKCWRMFTCHRKVRELNVTMEMTVEQALQLDVIGVGSRVELKEEEMKGNEVETEKGAADGNEDEKSNEARMTSKDEDGGQEVDL